MAQAMTMSVIRPIESLFAGGSVAGLSDRQLLERFVAGGDSPAGEAAFAAIVSRHGPMVLGVCRQLLGDPHHAEDAFQAAFLVLARRARSVRDPDVLGNWLYGVALRTARNVRRRIERTRRSEERRAMQRPEVGAVPTAERSAIDREQAAALHAEIERLPATTRLPVVLCYLEGLSLAEAARQLRCPAGTVHSRLDRAREKLRRGLLRRGFALPMAAIAAMLATRPALASIPPLLCDSTTRAAIRFAARHAAAGGALSASAAAAAREVLQTMLIHKLKAAALSALLIAVLTAGAGHLIRSLHASAETGKDEPPGRPRLYPTRTQPPPSNPNPPPDSRMTVTGRVLGPDGRPAAGVPVDLIAMSRGMGDSDAEQAAFVTLGRGEADADGRFRFEAARASSARFSDVTILAGAAGPGSGFGCVKIQPDDPRPTVEIHLPPEQVIRGRLVDVNSQPAAGVEVHLDWLYYKTSLPLPRGGRFDIPLIPHGNYTWPSGRDALRPWPKPVTTDAQGQFALPGVCRGLRILLSVADPRFARQDIAVTPEDRDAGKEVAQALYPARIIEGRVLAADTGRPIPNAVLSVTANFGDGAPRGVATYPARFRADDQGRFRINPYAGDYFRMRAIPPEGQPYLPGDTQFALSRPAVKKEIDLTLARGVLIRGKVTEEGTGRPVPGVSVHFIARASGDVRAGEDGSFQVAVPAGAGYLMVMAPTADYVPKEIVSGMLYEGGQPGGQRLYAHDIVAYAAKDGDEPREINPTLKPGKTLRGRVLDPVGRPVDDAIVLVRQQFDPLRFTWPGPDVNRVHAGRFELHGFDPEKPMPAYFLDAEHELGLALELSGKQAGEDLIVHLQPCGRAKVRFVGPDGKPVGQLNVFPYIHLLMTPGATRIMIAGQGTQPAADEALMPRVDFKHYPNGPSTDADGRIILPDLIPGALYRIVDYSTRVNIEKGVEIRRDFTVKPGETLDLDDILVASPKDGRYP